MLTSLPPSPSTRSPTLRLERPLNELLDDDAVYAAFRRAGEALPTAVPRAVVAKTLHAYRTTFSGCRIAETPGRLVCWRGHGEGDAAPRALATATIDVFVEDVDRLWRRTTRLHVERHHPRPLIEDALHVAGFELLEVQGDEDDDAIVYLTRPTRPLRPFGRRSDRVLARASQPASTATGA